MGQVIISGGTGGGVSSDDVTITKAMLPQGYTTVTRESDDEIVTGVCPVNGAQNGTLNCGQNKIIPSGYTTGGTVTANTLASQTPGTANSGHILKGYEAWINGVKNTGVIEDYAGQYITPSPYQQTVSCAWKRMIGDIKVNPIPANYLNIEAGQVVFRDGAFGRIVNKGWGFGFWRNYGNQKMLLNATEYINLGYEGPARAPKIEPNGLFFSVASNGTCDLILNGSIDLTRFSSITITYFTDSVPNTPPRMILQAVSANEQVCTQKYQSIYVGTSQLSLDISTLKGHHYILMRISYGGPGGARCHVSNITLNL